MRKKAGPVAIVIAVVAVVAFVGFMFWSTAVPHKPTHFVGAQEAAKAPVVQQQIQALMKEKYGSDSSGTIMGRRTFHNHMDANKLAGH